MQETSKEFLVKGEGGAHVQTYSQNELTRLGEASCQFGLCRTIGLGSARVLAYFNGGISGGKPKKLPGLIASSSNFPALFSQQTSV